MEGIGAGIYRAFSRLLGFDPEIWDIVLLSLRVSGTASLLAAAVSLPLAYIITQNHFPGRRALLGLCQSLMAIPAVVLGLVLYMLLSRSGPLGPWGWLYSPKAMILGQTLLALPLMTSLAASAFSNVDRNLKETMLTLGAGRVQALWGVVREAKLALSAAFITGLSRVLGEAGMAMMIGVNIRGRTRVMTTAIALETMKGNFELGLALGLVLLFVAVVINLVWQLIQGRAGQ